MFPVRRSVEVLRWLLIKLLKEQQKPMRQSRVCKDETRKARNGQTAGNPADPEMDFHFIMNDMRMRLKGYEENETVKESYGRQG